MKFKSLVDSSVSIYAQNTNAEIILAYFWAIITLAIFGNRYWTAFLLTDKLSFAAIFIFSLILAISSSYLIFNYRKIKEKYFHYHNDWLIGNIIQSLGLPVIVCAWTFFIIYNVAPGFPQFFPEFFHSRPIAENSLWLNAILFPYLVFSSIRRFTKIRARVNPSFEYSADMAERLDFKIWQFVIAISLSLIFFVKNLDMLGFAFVNSFLLSDLIFDIIYHISRLLKQKKSY